MIYLVFSKIFDKSIKWINNVCSSLEGKVKESQQQIKAFGIIFSINYMLFYFIWSYGSIQSYENLPIRLSMTLICLPLIFKKFRHGICKNFFPFYWYFTVAYCLPFFFLFMTLHNHGSAAWLLNLLLEIFLTFLLFDLIGVIVVNALGFFVAWFIFSVIEGNAVLFEPSKIDLIGALVTIVATFVIGSIFVHNREKIENAKLNTMKSLGASIAHELRTPLGAIQSGIKGVKNYLPELVDGYQIAKANHLLENSISRDHLEILGSVLDNIATETHHASNIVEMLLTNIKHPDIKAAGFKGYPISECIEYALGHYSFTPSQREIVEFKTSDVSDFMFYGDRLLVIHVLYNLLKNALYFIEKVGKGRICIWLEADEKYNQLHFKDTGKGIAKKDLPYIFDRFFTKETHRGSGIGLSFCKMVMEAHNGQIVCYSIEGEYTEFVLLFPQ